MFEIQVKNHWQKRGSSKHDIVKWQDEIMGGAD